MARVAFVQDVMIEYMGFMCMSAVLKEAGHTVEVFVDDQSNTSRFVREVLAFKPDVIGFSLLTPSVPWALELAPHFKEHGDAVVVLGNVHVMMRPDIVESPGVDAVCTGEGEHALLELCDALDRGEPFDRIAGLWVKTKEGIQKNPARQELVDMNAAPFIDRSIYHKYRYFRYSPYLRVMAGRGCPFRCSFCSNPVMTDKYGGAKSYIRKRSPENAVREIEHLIRIHPRRVKHIQFIDEVLWVKNEWLREFLPLYKERIGLPFTANFRFGAIKEEDIKLLADCGAVALYVAAESADEEQRRRLMNKPVTNAQLIEITGWMHKYGIKFGVSAFFGLPGDTVEDHRKRLAFYRQLNPKYLWTTFFQPYPGLALAQHPEIQKYMPAEEEFAKITFHKNMYLGLPDRDRLVNMKKVYFIMMKYPRLEGPLMWLTQYRIPVLFDFLFMAFFAWMMVFWWEKISFYQWLVNLKIMLFNPILRRKQPLQSTGRPFIPKVSPRES